MLEVNACWTPFHISDTFFIKKLFPFFLSKSTVMWIVLHWNAVLRCKTPLRRIVSCNITFRVKETVLWTQRFLTRNLLPKNRSLVCYKRSKGNVCGNSTFQLNNTNWKNATGKRRLTSSNRFRMWEYFMRRTTQETFFLTWQVNRK